MAEAAWQQALLHGGLGLLGGDPRLSTGQRIAQGMQSGIAGMNAHKQQEQQQRQDMMKMAQLQSQLETAQLNRQQMTANLEAQQEERKRKQAAALGKQGHMEALAAGKTPEQQALIFAGGDDYVKGQIAAQAPLTAAQQAKLDQNQSQFDASHGLSQAKLGLMRDELSAKKAQGEQELASEAAAKQQEQERYQAVASQVPPEDQATFWADPEGYVEQMQKAGFKEPGSGGKLSGDQRKALVLSERADKALDQIDEVIGKGYDPTSVWNAAKGLTKKTQSQEGQTFDRSFRDAATAILRLESGAVIGEDEVDQFEQTYKPSVGDTPETARQKMTAFKDYVANVRSMATATQDTAQEALQGAPKEEPQPAAAFSEMDDDTIKQELSARLKAAFGE